MNLTKLNNLTILDLNNLAIGDSGALALSKVLKQNLKFLEKLNLDSNKITSKGFTSIDFSKQSKIKVLSVCNNELSEECYESIKTLNFGSLEKLLLANNELSNGIKEIFQYLIESKVEINLEEINISNNKVDQIFKSDDDLKIPNQELLNGRMKELMKYHLHQKYFSGIEMMFKCIVEKLKKLKILNFSSNNLSNTFFLISRCL